jgi:UDP-N-acetylglucosamine 2-epimerase
VTNLLAECTPKEKILLAGNVMTDTLVEFRRRAAPSDILDWRAC